ncbi:ABC transporter permease [Desulfosudis oleivorans]|uniref:Transport permease protein n=1 Tax=Desulfosudis oleivorans (strain DSM 6200 / JCM 39069 / Hxd3) TaxID=96561 RepID=A8ZVR1_DESOH|nr:ABC transporter permease [Desulfosudis oleivorans]ABW66620.1 ABC-2 type transporter [Desulfosudis oleivorans Hxd3]
MTHSRLVALMRKEFIHISRDRRSLGILFLMPLMMMFVFGYAINMDVKNIRLGICDLSRTPESRALVETVDASPYFDIKARYTDPRQTAGLFEQRAIRAAVIIPRNLVRAMAGAGEPTVAVITDGTDANTATLAQNYLEALLLERSLEAGGAGQPVQIKTRILYNPDMESAHFVVPGIVALLLIMIGALLTSVTIAREKETGTMEQILVSPIQPHEVVLGKAVPYLVLAFGIAVFIIIFGHLWFSVPMLGSWSYLMVACLLYLVTSLAIGLLISTLVATQQVAMMLSLVATLLPSVMLSGFVFPVASMPLPLQGVSQVIPATHFLVIIRGIMLKGNGPADLWPSALAMVAVGVLFITIAIRRFRLKL